MRCCLTASYSRCLTLPRDTAYSFGEGIFASCADRIGVARRRTVVRSHLSCLSSVHPTKKGREKGAHRDRLVGDHQQT
jgi:hypothetical protein